MKLLMDVEAVSHPSPVCQTLRGAQMSRYRLTICIHLEYTGWLYTLTIRIHLDYTGLLYPLTIRIHLDYTGWLYTLTIQQVDVMIQGDWLTRYSLSLTILQVDYYKLPLPLVDSTYHHCHLHVRRGSKWVNSLHVIGWHQPFDHLVKLLLASL